MGNREWENIIELGGVISLIKQLRKVFYSR